MSDALISTDSLSVGYSSPVAENINIKVGAGEILTLVGPNGSGKSTLLKTLSGELKKQSGSIYINGRSDDTFTPRQRARLIAVLLTDRTIPALMTCGEVIETGRYPYTGYFGALTKNDKNAAEKAAEAVGVTELTGRLFGQISDGQRQRVLLARAICQEPRILLLDEPTSYLDIHHKIVFLETLRRLSAENGIAVIMSMHEPELARIVSDHAVCMKDGAVYMSGKACETLNSHTIRGLFDIPEDLYNKYM